MHTKRGLKKAFTLTELLVVVIILGTLSAVAVPKFSRVLETRRTTEAEDILSAVRTEQEYRCAQGKTYQMDLGQMEAVASASNSKNYSYSLTATGAKATSAKGYSIAMPAYQNGQLCCEGDYCSSLNKSYPACSALSVPPEDGCAGEIKCQGNAVESCGCKGAGTRTRTCDTQTGTWSAWSACSAPATCGCSGVSSRECGCDTGNQDDLGYQTRTCNTATGEWGAWGACEGYRKNNQEQCNGGEKFYECLYNSTGDRWYWHLENATCYDDVKCTKGATQTSVCGCYTDTTGKKTRTCSETEEWGAWSRCTGFKLYWENSCEQYKCVEDQWGNMSPKFVKNTCSGGGGGSSSGGSSSGGSGTWSCYVTDSYVGGGINCRDDSIGSLPSGSCVPGNTMTVKTNEGSFVTDGDCIIDVNSCVCQ